MATAKISLSVSVVTNNNTTYKVTAKLYYYGNGSSWNSDGGDYKISATGQSSKSGSHSFTASTSAQKLGEASFSWSKGSSKVSKKISASFATHVSLGTLTTSKTITVPAKPYYTVTYKNVNNSGSTTTKDVQYGNSHTLMTPASVTKYTFKGWKNSSGTIYKAGTSVKVTKDVTYTAVWELSVATIKFGTYTVTQTVTATISSTLVSNLTDYIESFNIDDTTLSGITISGTNTLIAKAKYTGSKYTLDTFVDSTLFKKDSSGKFKYVGSASTVTLTYSYVYLNHNLYKYHIDKNNVIQCKTFNNITGTQIYFNDNINNIQGYKPSGYYKKLETQPTTLKNFIISDIFSNNIQYDSYGYVKSANIQKTDTHYAAVYVNNSNLYTELECYDAVRTTKDKLNMFISNEYTIDEYISEDNSLNDAIKDKNGTFICGYVKYKSPYVNGDEFIDLTGEKFIADVGLLGDFNIKINNEVLQLNIIFINDSVYVKFWSTEEYFTNEFYYLTYKASNVNNDLNYPLDNTPIYMFIPSNAVAMDINKAKNVIAFGSEAPDDITEELVLFNRPIAFIKDDVMYQQFIITHDMDIVNISSGKYIVTADNCNLYVTDVNNTQYNLNLQKYDIVNITKSLYNDNILLNITLNRGSKSIIYESILI